MGYTIDLAESAGGVKNPTFSADTHDNLSVRQLVGKLNPDKHVEKRQQMLAHICHRLDAIIAEAISLVGLVRRDSAILFFELIELLFVDAYRFADTLHSQGTLPDDRHGRVDDDAGPEISLVVDL